MKKPAKRSRTRSGCLTCRDRHMKCDEQLPVCQNCIKSNRKCYRGVRLNFTQYSFYDPGTKFSSAGPSRVLDQSITIANLYHDVSSYRRYLKYHSPEDLRESDEVFKHDCEFGFGMANSVAEDPGEDPSRAWQPHKGSVSDRASFSGVHGSVGSRSSMSSSGPQWVPGAILPSQGPGASYHRYSMPGMPILPNVDPNNPQGVTNPGLSTHHLSMYGPPDSTQRSTNVLHHDLVKNFNINETFNPHVSVQNFLSSNRINSNPNLTFSSSRVPIDNPEFEFDIYKFINMIQSEQYYWILDLLNDLDVWKSIIPSYAINLVNNKEEIESIDRRFLMNCLLIASNSRLGTKDLESVINLQNSYFNMVQAMDITIENFAIFEILLTSITLILLYILNCYTLNNTIDINIHCLSNQLMIYNKIAYKFHRLTPTVSKRMTSVILSSSFHSIVWLKYLIWRWVRYNNLETPNIDNNDWNEDLLTPVSKETTPAIPDLRLNYFDIVQLNNHFKRYDFLQSSLVHDPNAQSTSHRLRSLVWQFISVEYSKIQPTAQFITDTNIPKLDLPINYITITNDKVGLMVLLMSYLRGTAPTTVHALTNYESKNKWKQYFGWLFN